MAVRRPIVLVSGRRKELPAADQLDFAWLANLPTTLAGHNITLTSGNVTTALGYTPANDALAAHLAGNESFSGLKTFTFGVGGTEGGEFAMAKPPSGTTLTSDVGVDIIGDNFRVFAANSTGGGLGIFNINVGAINGSATAWHSLNFDPAAKLNLTGGTLSGQLDVSFNVPTPLDANSYTNGHIELITSDGSFPRIGFHRGGLNATALYYAGEDGFGSIMGAVNNAGSSFRFAYSNFVNNWTAAQAFFGTNTATGGFSAGGMTLSGINSGAGTDYSVLNFYANRFLSYRISTDAYQFHNAGLIVDGLATFSGNASGQVAKFSNNSTNSTFIEISNTAASGRNWALFSSGGGPAAAGTFGIFDQSGGGLRFSIDSAGAAVLSNGLTVGNRTTAEDFWAKKGAVSTQQVMTTWSHSNSVPRVYHILEATGAYALYMLDTAGAAGANAYQKFEITLDAHRVLFNSNGITGRDFYAIRPEAPTTGVIFLGNSGARYLFYDGSRYQLNAAGLTVGGSGIFTALEAAGNITGQDLFTIRAGTPATGVVWLGNQSGGSRYLFYDGVDYQMPGTSLVVGGQIKSTQNFIGSGAVVLATSAAGTVYLRPNGAGSATGEATVNSAGLLRATDVTDQYGNVRYLYPTGDGLRSGRVFTATAGFTIGTATAGDVYGIYNNSGSAITITQGSGLTLRLSGTATTGNRTLALRGSCTIWFFTASEAIITGDVT